MANYLYNGVELPDINTVWTDKEKYPYAAVVSMIQDFYALCIAGDIPTTGHDDTFGSTLVLEVGTEAKIYILATTQEVANILGISEANVWTWYEDFTTKEGEYLCTIDVVAWASHDVLNVDGTVYLAASDPVPTSIPTPSPDPTSMYLGWLVGRHITGLRKIKVIRDAELIDGVLYIKNANAILKGDILEVT